MWQSLCRVLPIMSVITSVVMVAAREHDYFYHRYYLFDRAICTGLGDRLGTMLTLAALAKLEGGGAAVVFPWCDDPTEILERVRPHIPKWHGYNFSHEAFAERFDLPTQVVLVSGISMAHRQLPLVKWQGVGLPAEEGLDSVYTCAWRTTRLDPKRHVTAHAFEAAYKAVAAPMVIHARAQLKHAYVVLHLRGPDQNTFFPFEGAFDDPQLYCTGSAVRALLKHDIPIKTITNNAPWARRLLGDGPEGRRLQIEDALTATAYNDMSLLLGAIGTVQHAWNGWSSYSTVPALAGGTPLLNTFRGSPHRFRLLEAHNSLPRELHDCAHQAQFVHAVVHAFKDKDEAWLHDK